MHVIAGVWLTDILNLQKLEEQQKVEKIACNSENPGPRLEPLRNLRDYQRKELETAEEQEIRLRRRQEQ